MNDNNRLIVSGRGTMTGDTDYYDWTPSESRRFGNGKVALTSTPYGTVSKNFRGAFVGQNGVSGTDAKSPSAAVKSRISSENKS